MKHRKKKQSNFNYRQFYKDYYGIDFGTGFEVHHINLNRDCNEIWNLLLLPKDLHMEYHSALAKIKSMSHIGDDPLARMFLTKENTMVGSSAYEYLADILGRADYWVSMKRDAYRYNGQLELPFRGDNYNE